MPPGWLCRKESPSNLTGLVAKTSGPTVHSIVVCVWEESFKCCDKCQRLQLLHLEQRSVVLGNRDESILLEGGRVLLFVPHNAGFGVITCTNFTSNYVASSCDGCGRHDTAGGYRARWAGTINLPLTTHLWPLDNELIQWRWLWEESEGVVEVGCPRRAGVCLWGWGGVGGIVG
jgi:hypothetical protein